MSVIDVKQLTKDYGSGRGVFDVTFGVGKGEVFGFLGPNGAGKIDNDPTSHGLFEARRRIDGNFREENV